MSDKRYLEHLLADGHENHIMPFLWLREQDEATLRTEIEKIHECGIRAVCLESRPHPDFVGPGWWRDFDIVLSEAKSGTCGSGSSMTPTSPPARPTTSSPKSTRSAPAATS